jgi:hypothetical protein
VIAAAIGLSRTTVSERLKRAGVEMRRGGTPPVYGRLDLPVADIIERYGAGESTCAIGRSLGVSAQVIRERLIEAGVERRPKGTHRRPVRPLLQGAVTADQLDTKRRTIEAFFGRPEAKGMTQQEIADACNVNQSYVSAIVRRLRAADHGA